MKRRIPRKHWKNRAAYLRFLLDFNYLDIECVNDAAVELGIEPVSVYQPRGPRLDIPERIPRKTGCIYVLRAPDGLHKIGRSVSPERRVGSLNTGRADRGLELVCTVAATHTSTLETMLHQRFASKRVNGEWFDLTPSDIEWIAGLPAS